jgi:SPP1 family predicted phage head-tail adaptor
MVPFSRMRNRIQLISFTQSVNDMNEEVDVPGVFAEDWAWIRPLSGRELWQAQQVQPQVTHKVTIRFRTGVTPAMKVRYAGRDLNIFAVLNLEERDEQLELQCFEKVAV